MPAVSLGERYDRGFYTPAHRAAEEEVARYLEELFEVRLHRMPGDSTVDWYAHTGDGEVIKWWAELKCRDVPMGKHATVYLSVMKHTALMHAIGLTGRPALFVARFTDAVMGIEARQVNAWAPRVMGRTDRTKHAPHDLEPMLLVPIKSMDYYGSWPPP